MKDRYQLQFSLASLSEHSADAGHQSASLSLYFYLRIFAFFLFILETDFICLRVHAWALGGQKTELDAGSLELELQVAESRQ